MFPFHTTTDRRFSVRAAALAGILVALGAADPADAATIKVPQHQPGLAAAVAAAGPSDTIVLSEGTYFEPLVLLFESDLTVRGLGDVIVNAGGAGFALNLTFCSDVRIEGIEFRNASDALGMVGLCTDVVIDDCVFKGGDGDGVRVVDGQRIELVDSRIQNAAGVGIDMDSEHGYIANSRVVTCGHAPNTPAIWLRGAFLTAEGNEIVDDGVGQGLMVGENGGNTHNVLVTDNEIRGAGYDGIFLDDAIDCLVTGNVIRESGDDGIDAQAGADGNVIADNLIVNPAFQGLEVGSDGNVLSKNRVKAAGSDGVWVNTSADGSLFFKNKVKKSGGRGFYVQGDDHSFLKNVAKGSIDFDLSDAGTGNEFVGNTFGTILP